ncbi:MAG: glutamate racemase [Lachnospiraceae bacterium]|nr:glutamate racemase [Lachnospiraceae bacterium]
MSDNSAPIGVFDSGVGGLTVAREILRQMPGERIVYFGDTARLPYGSKSKDTVIRYSKQIIRFLMTKNVKAIVVACNTASSLALEELQSYVGLPMMGVIHAGAKAAVEATRNGKIGVIGTEGTIRSDIYRQMMTAMKPGVEVCQKACPLFVPLVEEGFFHDSVTDEIASRYLADLKQRYVDTLVLGCTHYPLLRSTLGRLMGEGVVLVNPAFETALELRKALGEAGILRGRGEPALHEFYVSDMAEKFTAFATSIMPEYVKETKLVNIEVY